MGVDVSTEVIINRSVEEVAQFATDPDNATKWYVNIKSIAWRTPKPLTVGSKIEFAAKFLGKKLVYTYQVTAFIPKEKFVMSTANGPFPMETTYSWERISDHKTKMILCNRGTPSGFSKLIVPIMEPAMRRANRKDLNRLKDLLEKK
jgi:hypothetical protein